MRPVRVPSLFIRVRPSAFRWAAPIPGAPQGAAPAQGAAGPPSSAAPAPADSCGSTPTPAGPHPHVDTAPSSRSTGSGASSPISLANGSGTGRGSNLTARTSVPAVERTRTWPPAKLWRSSARRARRSRVWSSHRRRWHRFLHQQLSPGLPVRRRADAPPGRVRDDRGHRRPLAQGPRPLPDGPGRDRQPDPLSGEDDDLGARGAEGRAVEVAV